MKSKIAVIVFIYFFVLSAFLLATVVGSRAVTAIADKGFDENYGARPLRRAIQSEIEDALSEKMLEGSVKENSNVVCSYSDGKFTFETK